jgi:uncharacterized protein YoxC
MERKDWIHWIVIVSLFVMVVILFLRVEEVKKELIQTNNEYVNYQEEKTREIRGLNSEIKHLEQEKEGLEQSLAEKQEELQVLEKKYNNLAENYEGLQEEASNVLRTIDDYQQELNESMEWFRANSGLEGLNVSNSLKNKIESQLRYRCIEKEGNRCTINTGCLYLVNSQFLEFEYLNDTNTSYSEDKLQSLNEFVNSQGGDCEDFSLFYKAELAFLLNECEASPSEYVLVSWRPASEEGKRFWLDDSHQWFIREAARMLLLGNRYPYVVCGQILDPVKNRIGGHCVIAMSKEKINSIGDIDKLKGGPLIEPQDGRYIGEVGEDIILIMEKDDFSYNSYISQIITDEDMFSFSRERERWEGFAFFSDKLDKTKKKLEQEIND